MKKVIMFLFLFSFLIGFSNNVKAAPTEVNTVAELKDVVENATEEIEVKLGDSFPKDQDVTLNIDHLNLVNIDGNKDHVILENEFVINVRKHYVNTSQKDRVYLDNFHFDGKGKKDIGFSFGRFNNDGKFFVDDIRINDSIFENSIDAVINIDPTEVLLDGTTQVWGTDLIIKNNKSKNSGAVFVHDKGVINLNKSHIFNNENSSNEVGGGAVTAIGRDTTVGFGNSRVENNKYTGTAVDKKVGGGAVYTEGPWVRFVSSNSFFKGNETVGNDSQDGGAVHIVKQPTHLANSTYVQVANTTFAENNSSGEGGAIAIDSTKENVIELNFSNALFYGNSAKKAGGAISIYADEKITSKKSTEFENITFYKNSSGQFKGGAISLRNLEYELPIKSLIFFENKGAKNYENIVSTDGEINSTLSLGVDNGVASEVKSEDVFGKYPVPLTSNRGAIQIGQKEDRIILPTISVIPKFTNDKNEVTKGIADLYEYPNTSRIKWDQRFMNSEFLTLGSVNNASIIYDANDGNFNLPELKEFTGDEYYEGSKPTQYASLELPGRPAYVKHAEKDLNISREGYKFAGWSTEKNGELAEGLQEGDGLIIQGQTKLFAIWKVAQYQTKYYGNGHTSGVAPKMEKSLFGDHQKVKDAHTLKRTGYKFVGWSEKATATKANLQPGTDYKVGVKNNFYAVWQRDSNEVKYVANKATSGKTPKSAKVLYGNSVKLKNAGTLKRKGYNFAGWSTNKKATKVQYKVGKSIKVTKPTTVYAVWKKIK